MIHLNVRGFSVSVTAMIAEDSPERCPTCRGVHLVGRCPLLIPEPEPITEEQDAITREFLTLCAERAGIVHRSDRPRE